MLNGGHHGVAIDLGAPVARAARQRLREIGGLDIAVLRMPDGANEALGLAQGPDLLDLRGRQELHLDADRRGDAGVIAVLVHAVLRARKANVRDLPQPDIEPRFRAERLVERDRIFVDLAHRIGKVEQRQQACRMPGRAGGQFLALDENAVAPALLGQMIKRGDADDAASDHDRPSLTAHPFPLMFSCCVAAAAPDQ